MEYYANGILAESTDEITLSKMNDFKLINLEYKENEMKKQIQKPIQNVQKPIQNAQKPIQNVQKPIQNVQKPINISSNIKSNQSLNNIQNKPIIISSNITNKPINISSNIKSIQSLNNIQNKYKNAVIIR